MSFDRQARLEQLFHQALDLPDSERDAFIERVGSDHPSLAVELHQLLESEANGPPVDPSSFLDRAGLARGLEQGATPPRIPTRIGSYEIDHLLGSGGMGTVYAATQKRPRRTVAVKTVSPQHVSAETLRRFEYEVDALASLRHPGIAQIYDAGVHEEHGVSAPYFAMEYVPERLTITRFASRYELPVRERVELIVKVCDAVQHGHQRGLIHRDLKPENILVDGSARDSQPKIIDFGIARAIAPDTRKARNLTSTGQMIGTLQYMSPEQIRGAPNEIDVTTDVYALGLILYELLAERLPYDVSNLPLVDAIRQVTEVTPEAFSTTNRQLGGDLELIVSTALAKDKARRYASPEALAGDLRRYLRNEPITARPPTLVYQVRTFSRRNPVLVAGILTVLVVAIAAALVSARWARIARHQSSDLERQLYRSNMLFASDAVGKHQAVKARGLLERAPARLRGWEWRHLASRLDDSIRSYQDDGISFIQVIGHDGRLLGTSQLAADSRGSRATIRDLRTGKVSATIDGDGVIHRIAFTPDGSHLVVERFAAGLRWWLEVWPVDGAPAPDPLPIALPLDANGSPPAVDWDYATMRGLFAYPDEIVLYDASRASVLARARAPLAQAWFHPSGRYVLMTTPTPEGDVLLETRDPTTLEPRLAGETELPRFKGLEFSADGTRMLTIHEAGPLLLWDTSREHPRVIGQTHADNLLQARLSPDASMIVTWAFDDVIRVWSGTTDTEVGAFAGHEARLHDVHFVPNSRLLVSVDAAGTTRVWDLATIQAGVMSGHQSFVYPAVLTDGDAMLVSGGWDGRVGQSGSLRVWDPLTGAPVGALGRPIDLFVVRAAAPLSDRQVVVSIDRPSDSDPGGTFHLESLDLLTGTSRHLFALDGDCESLALAPDRRRLASATRAGTVSIVDLTTGQAVLSRSVGPRGWRDSYRVAWSPDGRRLAVSAAGHRVELWDARTYEVVAGWQAHTEGITSLAFDPQGELLLSTSEDKTVGVWDVAGGAKVARLREHGKGVLCAGFSPDGERIAAGGRDGTTRLWSSDTFDPVATLTGHTSYVYSLAWSADGDRLYSGSGDGTIRIWGTTTSAERLEAIRARDALVARLEPRVAGLLAIHREPNDALQALRQDPALGERERQVALQCLARLVLADRP